ncbi:hypothetical protein MR547_05245, partial [bacterium]|nr:hypothetical protein [bacterium]
LFSSVYTVSIKMQVLFYKIQLFGALNEKIPLVLCSFANFIFLSPHQGAKNIVEKPLLFDLSLIFRQNNLFSVQNKSEPPNLHFLAKKH